MPGPYNKPCIPNPKPRTPNLKTTQIKLQGLLNQGLGLNYRDSTEMIYKYHYSQHRRYGALRVVCHVTISCIGRPFARNKIRYATPANLYTLISKHQTPKYHVSNPPPPPPPQQDLTGTVSSSTGRGGGEVPEYNTKRSPKILNSGWECLWVSKVKDMEFLRFCDLGSDLEGSFWR